jgi:hypothetical protein
VLVAVVLFACGRRTGHPGHATWCIRVSTHRADRDVGRLAGMAPSVVVVTSVVLFS